MDLREKAALFTAFGSGLAIGISGLYYFYCSNNKLGSSILTLRDNIDELKDEIQLLKLASQTTTPMLRTPDLCEGRNVPLFYDGSKSSSEIAASSTEDDEFFDFAESEEVPLSHSDNRDEGNLKNDSKDEEEFNEWLNACDLLLEDSGYDKKLLHQEIERGKTKFGERSDIMWRLTKATHLLGVAAEKGDKKKLAFEAFGFAKIALEKDKKNPDCHKWYAIAIGSLSDYVPTKEKIMNAYEFKKHVEIALKFKPNDATLHHMLGRWCTEISSLSWIERKVASALFSQVPDSSYEVALNHLLKAHQFQPMWKENILCICYSYISLKKYKEALKWVEKGLSLEIEGESDQIAHEKLSRLNIKYDTCRD